MGQTWNRTSKNHWKSNVFWRSGSRIVLFVPFARPSQIIENTMVFSIGLEKLGHWSKMRKNWNMLLWLFSGAFSPIIMSLRNSRELQRANIYRKHGLLITPPLNPLCFKGMARSPTSLRQRTAAGCWATWATTAASETSCFGDAERHPLGGRVLWKQLKCWGPY